MEARKLCQSFALRSLNLKVWYPGHLSANLLLKNQILGFPSHFTSTFVCVKAGSFVQKFRPWEKISLLRKMTFQRCTIVVGILLCYSLSSLEAVINCERQVFHPDCRGSQTKRSSIQGDEANYLNAQTLEDLFGMTDSSRKSSHPSRSRNSVSKSYEKSRLWTALLDRGLNPDAMYDWYLAHLEKNQDANRRNWMQDNFQEKNIIDGDY